MTAKDYGLYPFLFKRFDARIYTRLFPIRRVRSGDAA
jgi:hypothetical protein